MRASHVCIEPRMHALSTMYHVFLLVYVTDIRGCNRRHNKQRQVGAVSNEFGSELNLFCGGVGDAVVFRAGLPGAGPRGGADEGPAYVLAPFANSIEERTRVVSGLVQGLVEAGAIPKEAVRKELQVDARIVCLSAVVAQSCGRALPACVVNTHEKCTLLNHE